MGEKKEVVILTNIILILTLCAAQISFGEFWDRPDYQDNKAFYDKVAEIIDILYEDSFENKTILLATKDQRLVRTLKALKQSNERMFISLLRNRSALSDQQITDFMSKRRSIEAFKIILENDVLAGTDRYYTHGTQIELSFNNKKFENFLKKLGYKHSDLYFLCRQNLYNTSDRDSTEKLVNEPGNAGIAYCGIGSNNYQTNSEQTRLKYLDRFEIMVGSVGRPSFAKEFQNAFHSLIGDKQVSWRHQVEDKLYVHVKFEKNIKIAEGDLYGSSDPEYNIIVSGAGTAGSINNNIKLGVMINYRLMGSLIDLYIAQSIRPSQLEYLSMMSPETRAREIICKKDWSLNIYAGSDIIGVANNNRIDNTEYNVYSKALIYDLKAGLMLNYRNVYFQLGIVRRSSEWASPGYKDGPPHTYGILSLTVPFNELEDVGYAFYSPLRWLIDSDFREQEREIREFKKLIRSKGLTVITDPNDPRHVYNVKCD